jgi:membrane-bound lytic murein transglycosylase D
MLHAEKRAVINQYPGRQALTSRRQMFFNRLFYCFPGTGTLSFLLLCLAFFPVFSGCVPKKAVGPDPDPGHEVARVLDMDGNVTMEKVQEVAVSDDDKPFSCAVEQAGSEVDPDQSRLDKAIKFCRYASSYRDRGEPDKALDALDGAYALLLQIENEDNPDILQQKDDLRLLIAKRVLEIHASNFSTVNGRFSSIPMVMNDLVKAEIKSFQTRERAFFLASYKRSGRYRPFIVKELKKAGLPEELSWLPLIESGFKTTALSRARALGLWQFIPSTGYKFGLMRNAWIDQRLDPERATLAAIAYLTELHHIFGDWMTVLAGYNCGEGSVLRAIRRQRINYLDNFWDLYNYLPMETARYVPRFIATLHIIRNPEKYGFELGDVEEPVNYVTIRINKQVRLRDVEKALSLDRDVLVGLNPELRYKVTPPGPYSLKVPVKFSAAVADFIASAKPYHPPRTCYIKHRVRRGETLSGIAARYRSSVRAIARANRLRSTRMIRAGRVLKIPTRGRYAAISSKPPALLPGRQYVVRKGDTLWDIARKFNIRTYELKKANNLKGNSLGIGQKLVIPGSGKGKNRLENSSGSYVVRPGDTLGKIAARHGMRLDVLLKINGLHKNSRIYPGQVLKVAVKNKKARK